MKDKILPLLTQASPIVVTQGFIGVTPETIVISAFPSSHIVSVLEKVTDKVCEYIGMYPAINSSQICMCFIIYKNFVLNQLQLQRLQSLLYLMFRKHLQSLRF